MARLIGCAALLATAAPATAQDSPGPGPDEAPVESLAPDAAAATDSESAAGDEATAQAAVTRFELGLEIGELAEAKDFAAAAARLDELLALTEAEFGPESEMLAEAYTEAARIRSGNGDYLRAEEDALQAVEIYRQALGSYVREMIDPYLVLGDAYHASGDYPSALSAYDEARTVSRRVDGLLNMGQVEIIDRMTISAKRMNQFEEADSLQLDALNLVERSHEPDSPEAIDAVFKYALWLRENNLFSREREQYARIDRLIRKAHGDDSILLVRGLRERANSFRIQGIEENLGISGLRDALEILQADPDPLMMAEVTRDLGDWEVAFSRVDTNGEYYLRSWALLEQVENGDERREAWYDQTHRVLMAPLSQRGLSSAPDAPMGHVVVHFTVDVHGRTSDVVVVESDPPGLKDEAVLRQFRLSRFRPRIVDGMLVPARRGYDIQFTYAPPAD